LVIQQAKQQSLRYLKGQRTTKRDHCAGVVGFRYTQPNLLFSAFRFEDITHRTARNRFAFHGIASEDDFGI